MRRILAVVFLLSACVAGGLAGPGTVALFDGAVQVPAPPGYCVSTDNSRQLPDQAVVVIGRCRDGGVVSAALVTVTVGAPGSGAVLAAGGEALAGYLATAEGRATLARSGRAGDVAVERAAQSGPDLVLLLSDREAGRYWRAITAVGGRLTTVTALGTEEAPLDPDQGRALLNATLYALHQANPSPPLAP